MWEGENFPQSDTAGYLTHLSFLHQLALSILLFHIVRVIKNNSDWFLVLISAVFTIIKTELKFLHN